MKLAAKTAVLYADGQETCVPVEQVMTGDVFVVRPGENIPVDGVIIEGNTAVNESALQERAFLLINRERSGAQQHLIHQDI